MKTHVVISPSIELKWYKDMQQNHSYLRKFDPVHVIIRFIDIFKNINFAIFPS